VPGPGSVGVTRLEWLTFPIHKVIESVMRLNGWQRLWVVLTTGWTLSVALFAWSPNVWRQ